MARGRNARRRRAKQPTRPQPRTWEWLALGLLLAAVAGYFLRDATGYPLRGLGSIIWVFVLGVAFALGMVFFARYLVPAGWQEGLRLLSSFYSSGRIMSAPLAKELAAEADPMGDLPASLWTMKAGLVESTTALALVRGNRFARAAGPGYVRLEAGERIGQAIDLRRQLRRYEVSARTRDGIPVKTTVSVLFQLRRPPDGEAAADMPYPYDPEAVFQATYAGRVDETQDIQPWHAQLAPEAGARVVAALSNYTLDQLYGDAGSSGLTLAQIETRLERDLAARFEPRGVTVLSVNMAPLILPEDVVEQRINNWQALWQSEMEKRQSESRAQASQALAQARTQGQQDIIRRIGQGISATQDFGPEATEAFARHVLQALKAAIADDVRLGRVSADIVETLDRLPGLIGPRVPGNSGGAIATHSAQALPDPQEDDGP